MPVPASHNGLYYSDFMRRLCTLRDVACYLEIGVQDGFNLSKIPAKRCFGVDPDFKISVDITANKEAISLFRMTSDLFFRQHASSCFSEARIEMAFLDGMHLFEYLLRDFYNTEKFSDPDGVIIIHDCLPFDGEMIERVHRPALRSPGPNQAAWTGDVWKIIPILQKYRPSLQITLVDCAPTGLVCISNLDPASAVLKNNYFSILQEFKHVENSYSELDLFYSKQTLERADDVVAQFDHSLYMRC